MTAFLSLLISIAIQSATALPDFEQIIWRDESRCGINCAYMFLKMSDVNVEYMGVYEDLNSNGQGTSLNKLKNYLGKFGQDLIASKITPEELKNLSLPFIAFTEPEGGIEHPLGHFVIVVEVTGSGLTTIDGTTAVVERIAIGDFKSKWSGVVLHHYNENHIHTLSRWLFWIAISLSAVGLLTCFRKKYF